MASIALMPRKNSLPAGGRGVPLEFIVMVEHSDFADWAQNLNSCVSFGMRATALINEGVSRLF